MGTMEYRFYESGNEKAIVQLWNECLHHDPITPGRLRNMVLLDANFDPEGLRLDFFMDRRDDDGGIAVQKARVSNNETVSRLPEELLTHWYSEPISRQGYSLTLCWRHSPIRISGRSLEV